MCIQPFTGDLARKSRLYSLDENVAMYNEYVCTKINTSIIHTDTIYNLSNLADPLNLYLRFHYTNITVYSFISKMFFVHTCGKYNTFSAKIKQGCYDNSILVM